MCHKDYILKNKIVSWRKEIERGDRGCQFGEGRAAVLGGVVGGDSLKWGHLGKTHGR